MKTSVEINEIAAALAKAQGEMKNAIYNKVNPHFKNKFADLASIRDACVPILAANGVSVLQPTDIDPETGRLTVETVLIHTSGQFISGNYPVITDKTGPQALGAAMTYAKRQSLSALICISGDEDDDGEAAEVRTTKGKPPNKPKAAPEKAVEVKPEVEENALVAKDLGHFKKLVAGAADLTALAEIEKANADALKKMDTRTYDMVKAAMDLRDRELREAA
jgi:hypothetical protein